MKRFFCSIIGLGIAWATFATDSLSVKYLGIEHGLSNNAVTCIYQDHNGFMWFGTYDGLNKYDGYTFKVYRNAIGDGKSLIGNHIYSIASDSKNHIWAGTTVGLCVFNPITSRFSIPRYKAYHSDSLLVIKEDVRHLEQVGDIIFAGTSRNGVLVFEETSQVGRQVLINNNANYAVTAINHDALHKIVWVLADGTGLYKYDFTLKKLVLENSQVKSATKITARDDHNLWVINDYGLFTYNLLTKTLSQNYFSNSTRVTDIEKDQSGNWWITTDGKGVWLLSGTDNRPRPYVSKSAAINSNAVYDIFQDAEGRKWIGTLRGGINILEPKEGTFTKISYNSPQGDATNDFILSFCEDEDQNIWIGTDGAGLQYWNRRKNTFEKYSNALGNTLTSNFVTCITRDFSNIIWVGTYFGGINRFDKQHKTFKHYTCYNDVTRQAENNIWIIYEDSKKRLWASATNNGSLYLYNRLNEKFELFDNYLVNLQALAEDRKGDLWGGNYSNLIRIDTEKKRHKNYEIGYPVRSIYDDTRGNMWLGTDGGGLILFNRNDGSSKRYTSNDGLPSNTILRILEDKSANLWLSTYNGLCRFNTTTRAFKNYTPSDGLQSNQFSFNAALATRSGEFFFGGIKGFNVFYPDSIYDRKNIPPVFLTDLYINNKAIREDDSYLVGINTEKVTEISVPFDKSLITIDFTAIDYFTADKIKYAYYLKGWDKSWSLTNDIRRANYSKLLEGNYVFYVKVLNANGEWGKEVALLHINVLPPWYRTWWAYTILFLTASLLIYLYLAYRSRQTKLKYEVQLARLNAKNEKIEREKSEALLAMEKAEKEKKESELHAQKIILEKEKTISENRQSFFTNITHEFRTPLTMIINPVKDMLQNENEAAAKEELGIVHRNARRLLSLVDQLLLFKKTESDTGPLEVAQFNFYQLCHETWLYFVQQAKARNLNYIFNCPDETLELYGDKEKLEIVFYNLLSNALKYTPEKGNVSFTVASAGDAITIKISDSGTGIPKHVGNRLFEKYYRVSENDSPAKPGFGIGLYLAKEFIDKHKGQISYTSQPGEGTVFTVQLQRGKAHLGEVEVLQSHKKDHTLLDEIAAGDAAVQPEEKITTDGMELVVSDKPSILITDDNAQMRSYLVQVFQNSFIVHEAGSAEEGLKMAKELQPDIIISDVVMNDMTGIDFCRTLKESPVLNHIPFILITGSFSPESKLKGIEYGADDYITKPFEKNMLVARVQSLIRNQQNLQKYFYNEITHQENSLNITGEYKDFLDNCIAVVEKHLDDDDFNIQAMAREIGMSHSNLYKKIKTISGQSANAFIRFIRLRKAAEMFINTNYNINETAFYVGIKDIKYFREQFTKTFGLKPSEYIEKYRKTLGKNYKLNEKVIKEKK
jgi:signal transduction histidine kinase/ligand-binding sensor domain-containing protein/DNA-binding response OmpR family regulator